MPPANYPPPPPQLLNFSKTQRIVLLIDLHPFLTSPTPSSYLSAITSAAARLLRFPPLSASLFSYKLFFSSLSPLRSAAVLPRHLSAPSLSFDLPLQTLDSLFATLNSISIPADSANFACRPSVQHLASSLAQLIHDYAWETENEKLSGNSDLFDGDFVKRIRSNLVLVFSPIIGSIDCSSAEFNSLFAVVRDSFGKRDIHLCWIDVVERDELKIRGVDEIENDSGFKLVMLKDAIRKSGWGYCSTDMIILGSAVLPLGLIYPKIAVSFDFVDFHGADNRKYHGALSLEILDVNGMPLECKCCDLELVRLKCMPSCIRSDNISNAFRPGDSKSDEYGQDEFLHHFGNTNIKLHVMKVARNDECAHFGGSSEVILVRESSQGSGKNMEKTGAVLVADKVLEMLHKEMGGTAHRSQLPIWQLFLNFLYSKGYWAIVSISSSDKDTFIGSLKPFTSHLAILSVLRIGHASPEANSRLKLPHDQSRDTCTEDINDSNACFGSQTETSTSGTCEPNRDGKKRKSQRNQYKEMSWSYFCKAAFGGSAIDLSEIYCGKQFEKIKKLKFMRCWMKQIIKVEPHCLATLLNSKSADKIAHCNGLPSEPTQQLEDDAMPHLDVETLDTFFANISKRIQHGLDSGMDLQNLAERVVKASISWLHQKFETEKCSEGQETVRDVDDSSNSAIIGELAKLLLKKPKEMKKLHHDDTSPAKASDPCSSREDIVREYEMQILLRMEILQSDVSEIMEEFRKQKLLKQICSMLEIIQFLVGGGIHGHVSLYDYVERTIKARYSDRLEDVVEHIYSELDLLPFGEEGETPSLLFNSEDSNQSWRDRNDGHEKAENKNINRSVSAEGDSLQPLTTANESPEGIAKDDHARILNDAKERRERNRRFASFSSRAPDLQRVWAPKQPKMTTGKFDFLPKKSKRKEKRRSGDSVVHETPMTGNKRSFCRENNDSDSEHHDLGNSYSVSKALFQDD